MFNEPKRFEIYYYHRDLFNGEFRNRLIPTNIGYDTRFNTFDEAVNRLSNLEAFVNEDDFAIVDHQLGLVSCNDGLEPTKITLFEICE